MDVLSRGDWSWNKFWRKVCNDEFNSVTSVYEAICDARMKRWNSGMGF